MSKKLCHVAPVTGGKMTPDPLWRTKEVIIITKEREKKKERKTERERLRGTVMGG